ncbi:hypothetical protein ACFLTD_02795, partial [Elusimicrobiota bacterium]
MRKYFKALAITFLLCFSLSSYLSAQQGAGSANNKKDGKVTIPWKEFRQILSLDKDEIIISAEYFQKILQQTGIKTKPEHTFKEGNVVLSRDEFRRILDKMKPHADSSLKLPADYLITKAQYNGYMEKESVGMSAKFTVWVLKEDAYLKIPLFPHNTALRDIKIDGVPALIIAEGGYHKVAVKTPGEHTITADFSVRFSLEKGPQRLNFPVPATPITLLDLTIPLKDIEIESPQAQHTQERKIQGKTIFSAVYPPTSNISINWTRKVPEAEKIPAKLYVDIFNLISVEDDALRINADVKYNILHSGVNSLSILIPEDINVLGVTGEAVGEWREKTRKNDRELIIPLNYEKKGNMNIYLQLEKPLAKEENVAA